MAGLDIIRNSRIRIAGKFYAKKQPAGHIEIKSHAGGKKLSLEFHGSCEQANDVMRVYEFFVRILEFSGKYKLTKKHPAITGATVDGVA